MRGEAAFYERLDDGLFRATPATIGPWSPELQHAGPPAALLAHALERLDPRPGARIARISVGDPRTGPGGDDAGVGHGGAPRQARPAPLGTRRGERPGGDAGAGLAALGRAGTEPGGRPPRAGAPAPAAAAPAVLPGLPTFPYGEALEWRFTEGHFAEPGPATVWTRCRIPLVAGEPLTGLTRLVTMVDSANGISWELPLGRFTFVPVDLNVVLRRSPEGEWVGMSATTTVEEDGLGMVQTRLFDAGGTLGASLHTLFVAPR